MSKREGGFDLESAFDRMSAAAEPAPAKPEKPELTKMREIQPPKPAAASLPSQRVGKRNHPDYEQAHFYLRKETAKAARRKCEDERNGDMSDLVEDLLAGYLGGRGFG